jgi:rhamnogalacturonyl hydrolase YesR
VPAAPNPKFWEYTNGVPLYALWLLYEKTGDTRYRDFADRFIDADGKIDYARPYPDGAMPNDPRVQDTVQPASLLFGLYAERNDPRYLKAMSIVRQVFSTLSVLHEDGAPKYAPGASS